MNPLFTIHAGEYLLASHIEQNFRGLNVWVPSRDTGVDLLVSDHDNHRTVSLQVKLSKDYLLTDLGPEFREPLRGYGWWRINLDKLRGSRADLWVLVISVFKRKEPDFVIIPPHELAERLTKIHRAQVERLQLQPQNKKIDTYLIVTEEERCWETRGLGIEDQRRIARGEYEDSDRDFRQWLNKWDPITEKLRWEPPRAAAAHP
jgi:hypothetical protein